MKLINPFVYNTIKFSNGKFGARKLTLKGYIFLMNKVYPCYTPLTRYTEDYIQFDSHDKAEAAIRNMLESKPMLRVIENIKRNLRT